MTARILVVDDVPANIKLLEARLSAEYFEVATARSGPEALKICEEERIDVVLLDVMMPGMDGFEVCSHLKANPTTLHIPIILVTALDQSVDRVNGLQAGADDFLTKPVDEVALLTRVKNLARFKTLADEMILRAATSEQIRLGNEFLANWAEGCDNARILLVEDHERSAKRISQALGDNYQVDIEVSTEDGLNRLRQDGYDLLMVSLDLTSSDGLRLCSQVRSLDTGRHLPILVIVEPGDNTRLLRSLDMGVNDYISRPIEKNEMLARVHMQIKRKRYADHLRTLLEESVELANTDPLTGLHNRRYMEGHMSSLVEESLRDERMLSILIVDIDFFKSVNDTYGHDAGDAVLKEFAERLCYNIREIDLPCRFGGEEFVVIMPDTDLPAAQIIAERLRECIAESPFVVSDTASISVTASVGVACIDKHEDSPETLLKRADTALYCAKRHGRNRVVADAA
ncbi:response regulator PleD [bacterium MnTg02]|nr:response regulator PleD [bacterium MnTg02]